MSRSQNAAFFVCGLINNLVYVIFLSAAVDLMDASGTFVPKSVVLLASIIPSLVIKSVVPIFLYQASYTLRVALCVLFSIVSLITVALTNSVEVQLFGIVLASLASGLGETTFLALTSHFNHTVISFWSSGTGAAGVCGAWLYLLLTSILKMSMSVTLLSASATPIAMALAYMLVLRTSLVNKSNNLGNVKENVQFSSTSITEVGESQFIQQSHVTTNSNNQKLTLQTTRLNNNCNDDDDDNNNNTVITPTTLNLDPQVDPDAPLIQTSTLSLNRTTTTTALTSKRDVVLYLLPRYLLPLFLVYLAEYTINQGVLPTIIYPLSKTPFQAVPDHYRTYQAIYQAGVFISRSSVMLFQLPSIQWPSIIQMLLLCLFCSHSITSVVLPSVWLAFVVIFIEGLIGGGVYVNCYWKLSKDPQLESPTTTTISACSPQVLTIGGNRSSSRDCTTPEESTTKTELIEHSEECVTTPMEYEGDQSTNVKGKMSGSVNKAFCFSVCGVADSLGITLAGLISLWLERYLCTLQHKHGNGLCSL